VRDLSKIGIADWLAGRKTERELRWPEFEGRLWNQKEAAKEDRRLMRMR